MNWKWLVIAAILLAGLTRVPVTPNRLTVEGVNLAFALEQLDPVHEQPHAPGFPFLVIPVQILAFFIPNFALSAYWIFLFMSVVLSTATLVITFKLASELYSEWAAWAASLLLAVNPVTWYATVESPTRPYLAFFTVAVAWFSWLALKGNERSAMHGAVTLAIAFGFLPEVVVYMLPLWILSVWTGTHSPRALAGGMAIVLAGVVLSLDILWVAVGTFEQLGNVLKEYPFGAALPSLTLPFEEPRLWVRSLGRFVLWNMIAASVWIWTLLWRRNMPIFPATTYRLFFLAWLIPAAVIHLVGGLAGPGQMLVYMPALCLIGARVLEGIEIRELSLRVAIVISVLLFGEFVTLPDASAAPGRAGISRVWNVLSYSIWETSLGPLRWSREVVDTSMYEVGGLIRTNRPAVVIAMNNSEGDVATLSWRVVSYYERSRDIWVLSDPTAPTEARRTRGRTLFEIRKGSPVTVSLPRGARVIWLMAPDGSFMNEVRGKVPVQRARKYVTYTDLPQEPASFTIGDFVFTSS